MCSSEPLHQGGLFCLPDRHPYFYPYFSIGATVGVVQGTKRQKTSGVWEVRVYVGRDPVSGKKRQISRTVHGPAKVADAVLRDMIESLAPGRADGLGVTFSQLLDRWLNECERMELSPTTLRTYRSQVKNMLRPRLGNMQISRLTAKHFDDLYGATKTDGKSPKTIRNLHATVSSCLHQAERWGWVAKNVAERAKPPRLAPRRMESPSVDVVRSLTVHRRRARRIGGEVDKNRS